jgi:hypothetical protein
VPHPALARHAPFCGILVDRIGIQYKGSDDIRRAFFGADDHGTLRPSVPDARSPARHGAGRGKIAGVIMKEEFARSISVADEIRTSGRWTALNQKICQLADNHNGYEAWQIQVLAALSARNFSEYLALKKAYEDTGSEPSLLAWRARNLLEISVWSLYCAQSTENARVFYKDAGRDVVDLCRAFTDWGTSTSQGNDWLDSIADVKQDISQRAATVGIESLEETYTRLTNVVDKCGLGVPFKPTYRKLSKFAHPTAMLIMALPDMEKEKVQRDMFYSDGCVFFVNAFTTLERALSVLVENPA